MSDSPFNPGYHIVFGARRYGRFGADASWIPMEEPILPAPPTETPPGIVGIFVDKLGRIIATVSDFDRHGYGGFSMREAQTYRVRRSLAVAVVHGYCSDMMQEGLSTRDCEQIVQRLVNKGATISIIPVGYTDEEHLLSK